MIPNILNIATALHLNPRTKFVERPIPKLEFYQSTHTLLIKADVTVKRQQSSYLTTGLKRNKKLEAGAGLIYATFDDMALKRD